MNNKEYGKWLRSRRYSRYALYAELIYGIVLAYSLILNFSLFMHLLLIQAIVTSLYLISGKVYDHHFKRQDKEHYKVKKRTTLKEFLTSFHFGKKNLVHLLDGLVVIGVIATMAMISKPIWIYLFTNTTGFVNERILTFNFYVDFIYLISLATLAFSILVGHRQILAVASVLVALLSLPLFFSQPAFLAAEIIGIIVGIVGFLLSRTHYL